jgi:hypothetical protein
MLAEGQCRLIARAIPRPIPDVPPTTTTFGGGFIEDKMRAFDAAAARTVADMSSNDVYEALVTINKDNFQSKSRFIYI